MHWRDRISLPDAFLYSDFTTFYRDLCSSRGTQNDNSGGSRREELDIPPVTKEEVKKAIKAMQGGKADGEDQITADLLKDGSRLFQKNCPLYTQCLTTSTLQESWKNANIILIHKKGDVKDLKNYRPISLLSVAYKVFTKVIGNRIRTVLDFNQPKDQAQFRKGYSTIDHIHTIHQVVEKCGEYTEPLYIAFIDYQKAFYSVETSAVMQALRNSAVDEPYVKILESINRGSTTAIVLHKGSNKIHLSLQIV